MHKKITKIMTVFLLTVTSGLFAFGASAEPEATAAEPASLYERLGAWDGISKVVADTIALHVKNPTISHYFKDTDLDKLHEHVTAFFAAGTGGPGPKFVVAGTAHHSHVHSRPVPEVVVVVEAELVRVQR